MANTRVFVKRHKFSVYCRGQNVIFAATIAGLLVQWNGCHAYLSTVHLSRTIKALGAAETDPEDSRRLETEKSFSDIHTNTPCRSDSSTLEAEVCPAPSDSNAAPREAAGSGTSDPEIESSRVDLATSTSSHQHIRDDINAIAGFQEDDYVANNSGWKDPRENRLEGQGAHEGDDSYTFTASTARDHDPSPGPPNLEELLASPGEQTAPTGCLVSSDMREPQADPIIDLEKSTGDEISSTGSRPPDQERADDEAEHQGLYGLEAFAMRELLQRREAQDERVRAAGTRVADALPAPQRASFEALAAFAYGGDERGGDDDGGDRLSREDERALDTMAICGDRSGVLLAFLRHANFDLGRSKESMRRCCAWRRENEADDMFRRWASPSKMVKHRSFWPTGFHKEDCLGRPVFYDRLGSADLAALRSSPEPLDQDDMVKIFCLNMEARRRYVLTRLSREAGRPVDQITTVMDLSGLGLRHMTKDAVAYTRRINEIFQDNFAGMTCSLLLVNAPWVFSKAWAMIKGFLSAETRAKMKVMGSGKAALEGLAQHIPGESIPDFLGGPSRTSLGPGDPMWVEVDAAMKTWAEGRDPFVDRRELRALCSRGRGEAKEAFLGRDPHPYRPGRADAGGFEPAPGAIGDGVPVSPGRVEDGSRGDPGRCTPGQVARPRRRRQHRHRRRHGQRGVGRDLGEAGLDEGLGDASVSCSRRSSRATRKVAESCDDGAEAVSDGDAPGRAPLSELADRLAPAVKSALGLGATGVVAGGKLVVIAILAALRFLMEAFFAELSAED